jgi:hypothetical protein
MSDPLRIGFVIEGPTDRVILEAAVARLLGGREFVAEQLSPELSESFAPITGGGWTTVYFWCRQAASQSGGSLRNNLLFEMLDVLIVHVDADVAGKNYADDHRISDAPDDLPCEQPCPPASATTDVLRPVVLGWMGEMTIPPRTVLCTPSKTTDTWVLAALFPQSRFSRSARLECHPDPGGQLQIQPLAQRLIRGGRKDIQKYRGRAAEVAEAWPRVRQRCSEAERFSAEFIAAVPQMGDQHSRYTPT